MPPKEILKVPISMTIFEGYYLDDEFFYGRLASVDVSG